MNSKDCAVAEQVLCNTPCCQSIDPSDSFYYCYRTTCSSCSLVLYTIFKIPRLAKAIIFQHCSVLAVSLGFSSANLMDSFRSIPFRSAHLASEFVVVEQHLSRADALLSLLLRILSSSWATHCGCRVCVCAN